MHPHRGAHIRVPSRELDGLPAGCGVGACLDHPLHAGRGGPGEHFLAVRIELRPAQMGVAVDHRSIRGKSGLLWPMGSGDAGEGRRAPAAGSLAFSMAGVRRSVSQTSRAFMGMTG